MKYLHDLSRTKNDQIVQFRLRVIKFADQHSVKAACEAFDVSRSTIYLWKKKLREARYRTTALIPKSTRPKHTRRMIVDDRILEFIKNIRKVNHRFGKRKIKMLLDEYCLKEGIKPVSESTIGRIIKRYNLFYPNTYGRIYHNPDYNYRKAKKRKKARVVRGYRTKQPGDLIQIDTIVKFDYGIKRYILTAIDLYSRFSFAFSYERLNSRLALDFYQKLERLTPFEIKAIKTDNGSEFLGEFDRYLEKQGIKHYFSYPRRPQSNAYIERFNRTVQEEFVDYHLEYLEDTKMFNSKLIDYLLFYNAVRPHQSLDYSTPMGYLLKEGLLSKMCWTSTKGCKV